MNQISEKQLNDAEKQFKTFESMINSMTHQERSNPDLLAKVSSSAPIPDFSNLFLLVCLIITATLHLTVCLSVGSKRHRRTAPPHKDDPAQVALSWGGCAQTASRRRRIARGSGRAEVDVTNMIGTFSGMRAKMQSMSKMMKMGGGARPASCHPWLTTSRPSSCRSSALMMCSICCPVGMACDDKTSSPGCCAWAVSVRYVVSQKLSPVLLLFFTRQGCYMGQPK